MFLWTRSKQFWRLCRKCFAQNWNLFWCNSEKKCDFIIYFKQFSQNTPLDTVCAVFTSRKENFVSMSEIFLLNLEKKYQFLFSAENNYLICSLGDIECSFNKPAEIFPLKVQRELYFYECFQFFNNFFLDTWKAVLRDCPMIFSRNMKLSCSISAKIYKFFNSFKKDFSPE